MSDLVTLGEQLKRKDISSSDFVSAETLATVDAARVFNISLGGAICSPSDLLPVHIVRLKDESPMQNTLGKPWPLFLHVGDWLYPLIPGESPVLYSTCGAYIFPDLMAPDQGKSSQSFVALMFPEDLLSETRQSFHDLLRSAAVLLDHFQGHVTSMMSVEPEAITREPSSFKRLSLAADKLSRGLFDAVGWIADEVEKGADMVKEKVTEESKKFQQKHKHTIEPQIREGIIYAREVTDSTVKISGYVVHKLGEISAALGREIKVPHRRTSNVDEAAGSTDCDPAFSTLHEAARTLERCLVSGMEDVTRY
ncbi:unnamed protein product, partial [Candidula unifasciata]